MKLKLSELINKGEYWSKIALHEQLQEQLDLCRLRPVPPPGYRKVSHKRPSLSMLDNDPTEVER